MYLSFSLHSFGVGCLVFIVQADGRGEDEDEHGNTTKKTEC